MKVSACPRCHKPGFLSIRPVKKFKQRYPYIGHYDSRRYKKEKDDYESGRRTSKPSGRSWHSLWYADLLFIKFEDEWYLQYQDVIDKIAQKYREHGFKNDEYLIKMQETPSSQAYLTEEFVTDPLWDVFWMDAVHVLQKNAFPSKLIHLRIFHDLMDKCGGLSGRLLAVMPPSPRHGQRWI